MDDNNEVTIVFNRERMILDCEKYTYIYIPLSEEEKEAINVTKYMSAEGACWRIKINKWKHATLAQLARARDL